MVVPLIVFLSSANLICRSTDISKCFIVSLGFRDNENRLYCSPVFGCCVDMLVSAPVDLQTLKDMLLVSSRVCVLLGVCFVPIYVFLTFHFIGCRSRYEMFFSTRVRTFSYSFSEIGQLSFHTIICDVIRISFGKHVNYLLLCA